jgi:hypothetical protein
MLGCVFCAVLGLWFVSRWIATSEAAPAESPALSEVVLFGIRPATDLDPSRYRIEGRHCVESYLKVVSSEPRLRFPNVPSGPEEAVQVRRRNLEGQMVALIGEMASSEAKVFASAVPLSAEWEGMSEGPIDEADLARQWLERYPETSLRPFLHLFIAHRLRAGYAATRRENARGLSPILAARYKEHLAAARSSSNSLIACIADDLEAQAHVYLSGFGRP